MKEFKNIDLGKYETRNYLKDEMIFYENQSAFKIGLIIKGSVEISSISLEGNTIIFNNFKEYDLFGNNLLFSNENIYLGDVISKEESTIVFFSKEQFLDLLINNKLLLEEYLTYESNLTKKMTELVKILSINSIKERFLCYLRFNNNVIKVKSITELSKVLNVSREALSRLISNLVKENEISYQKKVIKLIP